MDVTDLIESQNEKIFSVKSLIHFKKKQIASYDKIKDELSYDEIIMHVYYNESYKNAQQYEIQMHTSGTPGLVYSMLTVTIKMNK